MDKDKSKDPKDSTADKHTEWLSQERPNPTTQATRYKHAVRKTAKLPLWMYD